MRKEKTEQYKKALKDLKEYKRLNPNSKRQFKYCEQCGIFEQVKRNKSK